jgi:hypothetical protein
LAVKKALSERVSCLLTNSPPNSPPHPLHNIMTYSNTDLTQANATAYLLNIIEEKEVTKMQAELKLKSVKGMICSARKLCGGSKGMSTQTLMRMRQVQSLESQRSKAMNDLDEISDLALELWSGEFTADVQQKAKEITDKPAVRGRGPSNAPKRRSSYQVVKTLLNEKTANSVCTRAAFQRNLSTFKCTFYAKK